MSLSWSPGRVYCGKHRRGSPAGVLRTFLHSLTNWISWGVWDSDLIGIGVG